jgi:hypothetical protein
VGVNGLWVEPSDQPGAALIPTKCGLSKFGDIAAYPDTMLKLKPEIDEALGLWLALAVKAERMDEARDEAEHEALLRHREEQAPQWRNEGQRTLDEYFGGTDGVVRKPVDELEPNGEALPDF